MVVTIALALWFDKSDGLPAAYGIAVSATMLMTSVLLLFALREIWGWSIPASICVAGARVHGLWSPPMRPRAEYK
jgi:KUP system potassium uptake protein